jgi:uncharacterized protein YdiU (UPF0061 family)
LNWKLQHTYTDLPDRFFSRQDPTPVAQPEMLIFNETLAKDLGLEGDLDAIGQVLSGNTILKGSTPISQAYAGHQFGHFTMLGDGRAVLLGEVIDKKGKRRDVQLKGSGATPYSRRGDGRATVASMMREYIMSEAMHSLGIPTSRSLAVVKTGERVYREVVQQGAVLTRVASSHLRVGTFEYARHMGKDSDLQALFDYAVKRHDPDLEGKEDAPINFFNRVVDRQIDLVVNWMRVGFIHGVMNTDNMTISGETIDYGPCAFLNTYDPRTVFSSIDTYGRYAFGQQPGIAQWNLSVLASALLPLIDEDKEKAVEMVKEVLNDFGRRFSEKMYAMMYKKTGIVESRPSDKLFVDDLLKIMLEDKADFTNTFIHLSHPDWALTDLPSSNKFSAWKEDWSFRITQGQSPKDAHDLMRSVNPLVIPRNHLVEAALDAAVTGDLKPTRKLLDQMAHTYDPRDPDPDFMSVPEDYDAFYQTFCGT